MIRLLNKERELGMLPQLFDILYENMNLIAPFGVSYEEEKAMWLSCVEPALEKAPRQIVLLYVETELAGFLQYYVNGGVFMVEEIQIRKDFHTSSVFVSLWKFMDKVIPGDAETIEAYAEKRNLPSRKLIRKLGMEPIAESGDSPFIHYKGSLREIRNRIAK